MKFRSIKGTKDILPDESSRWQFVESIVRDVMHRANYREIRTPVFEETSLFSRSIGELTDIVTKEMYTFSDRGGDSLTLRPEGTASVLRSYIQHNLGEQSPLTKLYYIGAMFRQERPQAGRLRQFHQFGSEALGSQSPQLDAEIILLPLAIYRKLGVEPLSLKINSVGCQQCRPAYKEKLITALKHVYDQLSPESQGRVQNNPLRVLDSKDERDQALTQQAPLIKDHLCEECKTHFEQVQEYLNKTGTGFDIDGRLVRGLDYYTKTAFEITSSSLGSQDALAGGGRYDLLVEELGGKPTPGVGFAAGLERLMIVLEKKGLTVEPPQSPHLFIAAVDEPSRLWAFTKTQEMRSKGFVVESDALRRSLKAQMREANRQGARFVIVVGETELKAGSAQLKAMAGGGERTIRLDELEQALA